LAGALDTVDNNEKMQN